MSFSASVRATLRSSHTMIPSRALSSSPRILAAKSPIGEAISQVAKAEGGTEKGSQSAKLQSEATKALNGDRNKSSVGSQSNSETGNAPRQQGQADREANFAQAEAEVSQKLEKNPGSVSAEDAAKVQSREHRAFGKVSRDGVAAEASKVVDERQK